MNDMNNNDDHVLDDVDSYLHQLLPRREANHVTKHCRVCPICRVALSEAQKRFDAMQALPRAEVSDDLLQSVERKVWEHPRRRFSFAQIAMTGIAAAALVIASFHVYYARLEASPYELRLLGQSTLLPGSEASLRVVMLDRSNEQPLAGVPVTIELCSLREGPTITLASAVTDRAGTITPRMRLPEWQDGDYELRVTAQSGSTPEVITRDVKLRRQWQLMLTSDKPVYQPGQTIRLRSLARRRPDLKPITGQEVSFTISDSKGNKIFRQRQVSSRFGIAFADCPLAAEITEGPYQLECEIGDMRSALTVEVKKYVLPKFKIEMELDRRYYEPGQKLSGTLRADYFFGQPVAAADVKLELRGNDVGTQNISATNVRTDASGKVGFEFLLPQTLVGKPQRQGDSPIEVVATVQDTAGQQQSKTVSSVVTANPIHIEVLPEAGKLVRGVTNTVYLLTTYPDGEPAKTRVKVSSLDHELTTNALGLASLQITPVQDKNLWVLNATDDEGRTGRRDVELDCSQTAQDFLVRTDKAVYTSGETIAVAALGAGTEPIFLDLIKDGQTILTASLPMSAGKGDYEFDLPPSLFGAIELSAYRYDAAGFPVRKTRTLYVRQAQGVRIATALDRTEYRPGERAKLKFTLTDERGEPAPGALSLAAVDEAVFNVVVPNAGLQGTFTALENQLLKPVYQIYDWSPDFWARQANVGNAKELSAEERNRFEQALFTTTTGPLANDLTDELLPYMENDRQLLNVLDRPDWEELAESARLPKETVEMLRNRHGNYSLTANSFAAKQLATEQTKRVGIRAVKFAWILLVVLCIIPSVILVFLRLQLMEVLAVLVIIGMLLGLMLPAVQSAREASRRNSALNDLKQLGIAVDAKKEKSSHPVSTTESNPTRLRQWFPETLLWRPELVTDDRGQATLDLDLADSITTWRLSASAVTAAGMLGAADEAIRVFQPFFVDLDLPVGLTRGDEVSLPIVVYNYLDRPQTVELRMSVADGIELLDDSTQGLELAVGEVRATHCRVRAAKVGTHAIEIHATAGEVSDAVKRQLEITPEGRRVEQVSSGTLQQPAEIDVTVPETAIPGSAQTLLKIYPSSFSQLVEGLDAIFAQPYGCFEQTSSTTYPNVLALDYLRRTKQSVPAVEVKAREYIHLGYQRLLSFEIPGGGFDWFGNPPANRTLSAYGLLEFADMAKVHDVDPRVIERTRQWLLGQQLRDGSWQPEGHGLHEDPTRRGDLAAISTTAYVATAVFAGQPMQIESQRALHYLRGYAAESIDDPYVLALVARGIAALDALPVASAAYLDRLNSLRQLSADGKQSWWRVAADRRTMFYGSGRSGDVETTALATLALVEAGRHPETARGALAWLVEQKDGHGMWGSTQATVLALKALLSATAAPLGEGKARMILLAVDGNVVERISIPAKEFDVVRQVNVTGYVGAGKHRLTLTDDSGTGAGYSVVASHHVPAENVAAGARALAIGLTYDRAELATGETLGATARIVNGLDRSAPMVVLDLPIPAGFAIQAEDFDQLISQRKIAKYQVTPQSVIVYLRELAPKQPLELPYRLRATMPVKIRARGGVAYEYYNHESRAESVGVELMVRSL